MITPRTTRLVRVSDLRAFREAVVSLACAGDPLAARDRLVLVPTHAAAAHVVRSIENRRLGAGQAVVLPDMITRGELLERVADRLPVSRPTLGGAEREALLGAACHAAIDAGVQPPFRLRPGLIAEIRRFYDTLQLNQTDIDTYERLALGALDAAGDDRGAERLARQTRFLVRVFRDYQDRCRAAGVVDEHGLRHEVLVSPSAHPWRHVIVTVGDNAGDPYGLFPADWDLLSRVPHLGQLDVVATTSSLAAGFHERVHRWLPGIDEIAYECSVAATDPLLLVPPRRTAAGAGGECPQTEMAGARRPIAGDAAPTLAHSAHDREEEVASFARRVRSLAREPAAPGLDRMALVVRQPLPYVYLAREVFRSAAIPYQLFDALPLAAEPFAAALDLVLAFVSSNGARPAAVALLRSPHFTFETPPLETVSPSEDRQAFSSRQITAADAAALDRALGEAGYLGGADALERFVGTWRADVRPSSAMSRAVRAARAVVDIDRELAPLRSAAPMAEHVTALLSFLDRHESLPDPDDPLRERQLRARAAVVGTLVDLRDAYGRFDPRPVDFDVVAATLRRRIEGQTFAPRTGDAGVHVVDAASAVFGDFEFVQLAGLVDGEWPDRPRRSIFYSPALLRDLGWPPESARMEAARAAFRDLLRLPSSRLAVSAFAFEDDAVVAPSNLIDEVEAAGLPAVEHAPSPVRIFEHEALALDPVDARGLDRIAAPWAALRLEVRAQASRTSGITDGHVPDAYSVSALERYLDCPFKYFASDVLGLEEPPEDGGMRSPRTRGRFLHEVFERFFQAWQASGGGTITPERLDAARALFADVVRPMLEKLPPADAELERARLFGSAAGMGIVDVVLGLEASRPADVRDRWLEYRLQGDFSLGAAGGRAVPLRGVADRIDLLAGDRLRIIDYKSGSAPNPKRALQVAIYALCAQERLGPTASGRSWAVDEAAYVAFSGRRALVPVVEAGASDGEEALAHARDRLFSAVGAIAAGTFPPRPHDPIICGYCAYASVCRKDYIDRDE